VEILILTLFLAHFLNQAFQAETSLDNIIGDSSNNDPDIKHRFEMPTLRNTPTKIIVGNGLI
jgi:hypothetical protein